MAEWRPPANTNFGKGHPVKIIGSTLSNGDVGGTAIITDEHANWYDSGSCWYYNVRAIGGNTWAIAEDDLEDAAGPTAEEIQAAIDSIKGGTHE